MESKAVCPPLSAPANLPFSSLALHSLRLKVKLGCGAEERLIPQYVRFDVRLRFSALPQGCFTDRLEETVCYAEMSESVRTVCNRQEYCLIEKLGWDAYSQLKKILPPDVQLWVRVVKEKPPVADLEDGTSFTVGDWEQL
jgi:dihydroneopterin aldolase